MVNDHVKDLNHNQNHQYNSSDDEAAYRADEIMSISDWESYYERDLFTMWERLRGYTLETGAAIYMLDHASYTDFVDYCYTHSSKKMYMYPVGM